MKTKILLLYFLLTLCSNSFGQINQYGFKRELSGVKDHWHKIVLPDEIFNKVSPDLSDIRIFGLTESKDTIEAPYILQLAKDKTSLNDVSFNLVNQSKNEKGYYFTFEIPSQNAVNQIKLEFKQQNFDWTLAIEGSQDQREWFSIIENYRILSIKNELTDFQFTNVTFPNSRYRYFRLCIKSKEKPELMSAKMQMNEAFGGRFRNYIINSTKIIEDKQNKQSVINIDLKSSVPVCNLQIYVRETFDYYRPVVIKYLSDSIKTQNGWRHNYTNLTDGMINSIENNVFNFKSTTLQKLKIIIENQDNAPLHIDSFVVKGYVHELIVRFNGAANYYLTYGNNNVSAPHYDIGRFIDKIPATMTELHLGNEQFVVAEITKKTEPLFMNKNWLWFTMAIIIVLLGWFSLKMIQQK